MAGIDKTLYTLERIKKNTNKSSKRMGSQAELINHRKLEQTLDTNANMTPNSGARQNKRR